MLWPPGASSDRQLRRVLAVVKPRCFAPPPLRGALRLGRPLRARLSRLRIHDTHFGRLSTRAPERSRPLRPPPQPFPHGLLGLVPKALHRPAAERLAPSPPAKPRRPTPPARSVTQSPSPDGPDGRTIPPSATAVRRRNRAGSWGLRTCGIVGLTRRRPVGKTVATRESGASRHAQPAWVAPARMVPDSAPRPILL